MTRLTIRRPDDWHLHLRDGAMMEGVLPESARHFARAIVMPNLIPPVVTGAQAAAYRDRILAALPEGSDFRPLMTLYLTEDTDPDDVAAEERLAAPPVAAQLPADVQAFLFTSSFREAQWIAKDACLATMSAELLQHAERLATEEADGNKAFSELIERVVYEGPYDPDPIANELFGVEEVFDAPEFRELIEQMRSLTHGQCAR